jgi:hypothetical protein
LPSTGDTCSVVTGDLIAIKSVQTDAGSNPAGGVVSDRTDWPAAVMPCRKADPTGHPGCASQWRIKIAIVVVT